MKIFQCVCSRDYHDCCIALPRLSKSILFWLRYGHPAIDGVGLLPNQYGSHYLVFIQYSNHKSKVTDLFKYKSSYSYNPPELSQHNSIIEYYKSLAKISYPKFHYNNCLYVYISPITIKDNSDKDSLKLLKQHAHGAVKVGVMYKSSSWYLYLIK